ncbi:MAG: hypothetical protein Tp1100DCM00d2C33371621_10 [Prokaryotic dsDNA virus sp.]|nr:MAG: hypothetical protein Tp1100DCM00d2C33371621_10 [Prokaryotic dsDNA virus sp.]|tara:strand:+ start:8193 stop:9185 length:993 start_codon:yes stop_codon:yes gene_type:complete
MSKGKTTQTSATDPAILAMQQDLYNRSKNIAALPFTPYSGPRVAGFNPDQLAGFDATRNMFGQSMALDPRGQLAGMGQAPLDINSFQNPYQEQVIDNAMADLNRGRQLQIQSDQDAAIGRGAFGGSRSAVLEAETNRNFADRAGNLAANLRQQGFDSSVANAMQDRNFRSGINQGLLSDQYRNLGLLSGIGAQQQGLQQGAMDAGYNEFLRGLNYPKEQLGLLAQGLSGLPGDSSTTMQKETGTGDVLGTAAQLYGMYLLSDKRLKDNITLIGQSKKGHNVYTWTWNKLAKKLNINSPTIGVLAQEVMETNPDAVTKNNDGYYMVNYGAL